MTTGPIRIEQLLRAATNGLISISLSKEDGEKLLEISENLTQLIKTRTRGVR